DRDVERPVESGSYAQHRVVVHRVHAGKFGASTVRRYESAIWSIQLDLQIYFPFVGPDRQPEEPDEVDRYRGPGQSIRSSVTIETSDRSPHDEIGVFDARPDRLENGIVVEIRQHRVRDLCGEIPCHGAWFRRRGAAHLPPLVTWRTFIPERVDLHLSVNRRRAWTQRQRGLVANRG